MKNFCTEMIPVVFCILFLQVFAMEGSEESCIPLNLQSTELQDNINITRLKGKPPNPMPAKVITMVNSQDGYGYLGDLCVPGYNLTTAGPDADNRKWRVVCKAPSKIVAIVMAMNMSGGGTPPQGEFLQIRRRGLKGVTNTFQGLTLEKNSVLFAHVGYGGGASETSPFRLAYFCASHQNSGVANQIIRSKAAVRYIQSQPNGIAKTAEIIKDVPAALFSSDTFTRTLFNLVINEN